MRVLFVSLGVWVADQITKFLVKGLSVPSLGINIQGMEYGSSIPLIGNWLNFTFIENPNMAFGLEFGGKLFLTIFSLLASVGIVVYLYRHRNAPLALRLSLALILAGAFGNLMDRTFYGLLYGYAPLFYGSVVDFIDFDLFLIHIGDGAFKFWPIFNIADSAVTIGVVLLLFTSRTAVPAGKETPEPISTPVHASPGSATD